MNQVHGEVLKDRIRFHLSGRISAENSGEVEKTINDFLAGQPALPIELAMDKLEYISSAGLRILLRVRKAHPEMELTGVQPEVYQILSLTGFTEMMKVHKALREVSVEGAEVIGRGAYGTVYRLNREDVVKVYHNDYGLEEMKKEQEVARKALILGIPTAIAYDVVKVGDHYGSVYEMLDAVPFSKILAEQPEKMDWCVSEYVNLLKKIHTTEVKEGELPDARKDLISMAEFVAPYLPEESGKKLIRMANEVPHLNRMIHGDYHTKNVELVGDEVMLIDMDTLSVGHPIIEMGSMFNASVGFSEYDPEAIIRFQGYDQETSETFWKKVLAEYLGTKNPKKLQQVEDKARIIGYTRLIRRVFRIGEDKTEKGRETINHWLSSLQELLDRTDTLLFTPNEAEFEALPEKLPEVLQFAETILEEFDCPLKKQMEISVVIEEAFINIANYAYPEGTGKMTLKIDTEEADPHQLVITFTDSGIPYNPLAKEDPDVTLSAEERQIGGLGIFMIKKMMDDVSYEYRDGKNIFTLKKRI